MKMVAKFEGRRAQSICEGSMGTFAQSIVLHDFCPLFARKFKKYTVQEVYEMLTAVKVI